VDGATARLCPRCRAEYRPEIETCADCGAALLRPGESPPPEVEADPDPPQPIASLAPGLLSPEEPGLVCVRIDEDEWIKMLAAALLERGLPHTVRVETSPDPQLVRKGGRFGYGWTFGLYVRERDAEAAREVERELQAAGLPEVAGRVEKGERDAHVCPACGASLEPRDAECPACGLNFPEVEQEGERP
jgi:hypothetical protein